jgi:hypothetical protein
MPFYIGLDCMKVPNVGIAFYFIHPIISSKQCKRMMKTVNKKEGIQFNRKIAVKILTQIDLSPARMM